MSRDDLTLGVHVSIGGSVDLAVDRAVRLGCNVFQIFTRNPQGWRSSQIKEETVEAFKDKLKRSGMRMAVSHMPYLPNLASPDREVYARSVEALQEELRRSSLLGLDYVVLHLGSHLGKGLEYGQRRVAEAILRAYDETGSRLPVLLENMAGQKNSVGSGFEDLRRIIEFAGGDRRVGVCLDTCHAYAAGYDLSSEAAVKETLEKFELSVDLKRFLLVHLNDSKGGLGCHLDRHENIGRGYIGRRGFRAFLHDICVRNLPMILETPIEREEDWAKDMSVVRKLYNSRS
jgi:deoxyribonuclease-4